MRPVIVTQTNAGSSNPAILDYYGGSDVAIQVDIVSGSPTWTVEQTLNNPLNTAVTPTWIPHPDTNMVSQTVARQGNYSFAPLAARLVVTGTGVARMTIVQHGAPGDR